MDGLIATTQVRRFPRLAGTGCAGGRPLAHRRKVATLLDAKATIALAEGWTCLRAAEEGADDAPTRLTLGHLPLELAPESGRPGNPADWGRFDAAWDRVRREQQTRDLTMVGLALLAFAQACSITAMRMAALQPATV